MKQLKFFSIVQVLFALTIIGGTVLFMMTRQQTQAGTEPILTPSYLAYIVYDFTPTPTATATPLPTNTPVPTAVNETSADTSVIQGLANSSFNTTSVIYTGYHKSGCFNASQTLGINRGLIKFNIPSTPAGATIANATLNVHLAAVCWLQNGSRSIRAIRLNENWTASNVTWNNQPGRAGSASGSLSILVSPNVNFDWYSMDITGLVQSWSNGSTPNRGLMLRSPEDGDDSFAWILFGSEDNSNGIAPYLTITYNNGQTAVVAFNNIQPDLDASHAATCGTTAEGMSYCALDAALPVLEE